MPFYLKLENGDKILLENLAGFLILEDVTVPPATINYQAGGAGHPGRERKRKRYESEALFARMERTLQEALGLVEPLVADAPSATGATLEVESRWTPEQLEASLADLEAVAAGAAHYQARLRLLHQALADYDAELRARDDDDEFWMLMS